MGYEKQVRCKQGLIRNFVIDSRGQVTCTADPDYNIPSRLSGKKKVYKQVQLMRGGTTKWYYVHRLQAYSWLGESPHLLRYIVDHIDGDSLNNGVNNLRWVTPTANNINKRCDGIVVQDGMFIPRIAGFNHVRYKTTDRELCQMIRRNLVESYVRYNCRFPEVGSDFPHFSISNY